MFFSTSNKTSPAADVVKPKETKKEAVPETPRSAKITERLNKVVTATSPLDKNRSSDLVPLTSDYEQMRHKLRALVTLVKNYQTKTAEMHGAKFELVEQMALMSERSPLHDEIGNDVDEETSKQLKELRQRPKPHSSAGKAATTADVTQLKEDYGSRQGSDMLSLYGLYSFGAAQSVANDNEFQSHVVDYVVDWERIVTTRVDADLKRVKELAETLRHYEEKVTGLREKANHVEEKGKEVPKGQHEKLERNEEKLKEAFAEHEREAGKLCALLEAATHDGYKDLYPLIKNYMKWEMNRIGREHDIAERLSETLEAMNEKMGSKKRSSSSLGASDSSPQAEEESNGHKEQ